MIIFNREITKSETLTKMTAAASGYLNCQASFNSHGQITLRNYDARNKDTDEIIILSGEETQAVIQLFSRLGTMFSNNTLPF